MNFLSELYVNPDLISHGANQWYIKIDASGKIIKTTNVEETDPTVPSYVKTITSGQINTWDQAYSWGNHAGLYRPISYVPSWAEITSKPTTLAGYGITDGGLATADITAVGLTTTTLTLTRAAGNLTASVPTWNQNTTGSAASLTTARTLTIGNTGKTFNGTANVTWSLAEIGAAALSHTHSNLTPGTGISGSTYNGATAQTWSFDTAWGDARYALTDHKYHSFSTDSEFYDSYAQANYLRLFTENATFDNFRFRPYTNVEYHNGSAWVTWSQSLDTLFDGREDTGFSLTSTYKKFRFEITRGSGWPTTALFVIQTTWSNITSLSCTVTLETWNGSAWVTKTSWTYSSFLTGLNLRTVAQTHDGFNNMRVTLEFNWTAASHDYLALRRILFLSNYSGTQMYPWTWNYNQQVTFSNSVTATSFIRSGGTSSQFLKADGSIDSTIYQTALTNPITGTGTTNYLSKFTAAGTIGNSQIIDNGTNIGFGLTVPQTFIHIRKDSLYNSEANTSLGIDSGSVSGSAKLLIGVDTTNDISYIQSMQQGTGWTKNLVLQGMAGNVLIGSFSGGMPTSKLDINGDLRVRTLNNATGNFVTTSGTGVLQQRTPAQVLTDIGAQPAGSYASASHTHPASEITAGTFGAGNYTFAGTVTSLVSGESATLASSGVIFARNTSYLQPDSQATRSLFVGGFSIGAADWVNINFYSTTNFRYNNQNIFHDGYHPNADTLTTARTFTIGSSSKTFNGSANVSWTLAEIGADTRYLTRSAYHFTNGFLIQTDIPTASNTMFTLHVRGNGYTNDQPFDIMLQGYLYNTSDQILSVKAHAIGARPTIEVFCYNGFLYFHIPQTGFYQSIHPTVYSGMETQTVQRVVSISNAAVPGTGVTRQVSITPTKVYTAADRPDWIEILNKPSTFTPSSHTHSWADITSGKPTTLAGYGITDGGLATADITAVSLTTTTLTLTRAAGNITASVPTWNQNTTGSAATLTTARTIWGQSFNGSANISGALSGATTIAMSGQLTNTVANGTAPFVITSTTRVNNLNVATAETADMLYNGTNLGDLNSAPSTNPGYLNFRNYIQTALNKPVSINNANGVLTMVSHASGPYGKQIAFADNDDLYIRKITAGAYGTWYKLWHNGNFNPSDYVLNSAINNYSLEEDVFTYSSSYSFTLSKNAATSVQVFLNGVRLVKTLDWTISGNVVTVTSPLYAGDEVVVAYFYTTPDVVPSNLNGTGTLNYLTKWGGSTNLTTSIIQDNGSLVTVGGNMSVLGQLFSPMNAKGTVSGTVNIDWNDGNFQRIVLGGNVTLTFSNGQEGASYQLIIKQNGTGNYTVTWPTLHWGDKTPQTVSSPANSKDILTLTYDEGVYNAVLSKNHGV